jgi:dipeptidyl aminopeptidase/acylaminoacyl peptidase
MRTVPRENLRSANASKPLGLALLAFWVGGGTRGVADPYADWLTELYRPFQAEQVALAPDGKHVAFTRHEKGVLSVVLMSVDDPASRINLQVADDRVVMFSKERAPAQMQFMRWATANKIVFVPTAERFKKSLITPIFVANADGSGAKQLASEKDFSDQILVPVETGDAGTATMVDVTQAITGGASTGADRDEGGLYTVETDNTDLNSADQRALSATSKADRDPDDNTPEMKSVLRPIRVLGFLPTDRTQLLVEAIGEKPTRPPPKVPLSPTAVFKIDLNTGKIAELGSELNEGEYFYDWQGQPHVLYTQSSYSDTRTYEYRLDEHSRWHDLVRDIPGYPNGAFTLSPKNYYGEHAYPLSFALEPDLLYLASNVGRNTFAIESFNLKTKQRAVVAEHADFDLAPLDPANAGSTLVFDPKRCTLAGVRAQGFRPLTVWTDAEIAETQRLLDRKLPDRSVEILEWDDARARFLIRVSGAAEPGRYYVYNRESGLLLEFMRRAPWLRSADLQEGKAFAFTGPSGTYLTGFLTLPKQKRIDPPPLVVYMPSGFPGRISSEFDREAQALAAIGVMVVRVNHRGSGGQGIAHRNALQQGIDRIPLEDVVATIDWVGAHYKIDRKRIAAIGEGFGGYLALRALQLYPTMFRCAVAMNAPLDLESWLRPGVVDDDTVDFRQGVQFAFFGEGRKNLKEISVLRAPEALTKAILLVVDPNPDGDTRITTQNDSLRSQLKRLGRTPDYFEIGEDYARALPKARAALFQHIEEFFNLNLYNYKVDVGETKVVK